MIFVEIDISKDTEVQSTAIFLNKQKPDTKESIPSISGS
jgi:hypothetical protein